MLKIGLIFSPFVTAKFLLTQTAGSRLQNTTIKTENSKY